MLSKYPSIPNLFKRDQETHKVLPKFYHPVFEYLYDCKWHVAEKLDGTNIRVVFDEQGDFEVRGRTDKAKLKPALVEAITAQMEPYRGKFRDWTFVGEGTGPGIQKGWERYGNEYKFTAFDIVMSDGTYGDKETAFDIFNNTGIPTPAHTVDTLRNAASLVYEGFYCDSDDDKFAEGLVCTALIPWSLAGRPPVVKVKHRDIYQNEDLTRAGLIRTL